MDQFHQAFAQQFYRSEEYADFCARITGKKLRQQKIAGEEIFLVGKKSLAIDNYSDQTCEQFRGQKIHYAQVLPENNYQAFSPSILEYAIFHKTTYDQASKNYKTSFFHGLREGYKFPHETKIIRQPDQKLIDEIYEIYLEQMKRHNSFLFPRTYFTEFFACPSSLLITITYQSQTIAYFCCFENQQNLYTSIGGGHPRYFHLKASHKLYDEVIRYACEKKFNVHMGIGVHDTGYQKFKLNCGAINYRLAKYPDDTLAIKFGNSLMKFTIFGSALRLLSKLFPQLLAYALIPTT